MDNVRSHLCGHLAVVWLAQTIILITLWPVTPTHVKSECRTMRDYTAIDYAYATYEELPGIERRYTGDRPSVTDPSHH